MIRVRTAAALSAAALLGVAVLAGCSSSSESTETASAAASEGSAQLPAPVIITEDQTEATCAVGNFLDIIVAEDQLAGTTVATSDEAVVTVTQARQEGDALFNPGGECVAAGSATITVTGADNTTRDIAITVTE
jgi:hypothetical protein